MVKILKLLTAILLLVLTSCNNPIQNVKKTLNFPTKAFVKIYKILNVDKCNTKENCKVGQFNSTGSGISIGRMGSDSLILTAGHVCSIKLAPSFLRSVGKYKIDMKVQNIYGVIGDAKIINSVYDNQLDLCFLVARNLDTKAVLLSKNAPKPGDRIYSMAAPSGIFHPPTVPLLDGIYSGQISPTNSMITMYITYGASGGGVLNSDMELVGIIFATHPSYKTATLVSSHYSTLLFTHESFLKLREYLQKKIDSEIKN